MDVWIKVKIGKFNVIYLLWSFVMNFLEDFGVFFFLFLSLKGYKFCIIWNIRILVVFVVKSDWYLEIFF